VNGPPFLLAVDGTGLLVRCCRAPRSRDLFASDGTPTGALMMFIASLSRTVKLIQPSHLLVAWDGTGCLDWRREIYPPYKRRSKGFDFGSSGFSQAVEFLATAGIPQRRIAGFEADDILAAVARSPRAGLGIVLASEDADLLQLAGWSEILRGYLMWDAGDVLARYGVPPSRMTMLRALAGDRSDGIAGVPRVGLARAVKMLKTAQFQWPLPTAVLPSREHRDLADACYRVMDLIDPERRPEESPLFDVNMTDCAWNPPDHAKVLPLLERYELRAIAERSRLGNLW
jgi:5'-3' exonuclease